MVHPGEPTALYHLYDASERLLYVGISRNPENRWGQHARQKYWWPAVARRTVEWCDSRAAAQSAEATAIEREQPLYDDSSRQGAGWNVPTTRDPQEATDVARATAFIEEDIRTCVFPVWSQLPSRAELATRYALSRTAVDSALWSTTSVTPLGRSWFVCGTEKFPTEEHRRHGKVYALALLHFGDSPFTAHELVERTRVGRATVASEMRRWQDADLVSVRGEPRRGPQARFVLHHDASFETAKAGS
ncbi:GIY-YIG nuclease family protein [Streptomyces sp. NPDC001073]